MAVVWQKSTRDKLYQVRTAGNTVRLYTNGVFHSQFNAKHPVAGHLWDLLSLPAFFLPAEKVKRVLVLGVGGGAVINQINHFLSPEKIVGVDLDRVHLQVAKRWFKVAAPNVELVHANALDFVAEYSGTKFDLIIEDLFGDVEQDDAIRPCRAVEVESSWVKSLLSCLKPSGVLAFNLEGAAQAKKVGRVVSAQNAAYGPGVTLSHSNYQNAIAVFSRSDLSRQVLVKNLQTHSLLDQRRSACRLNFNYRKIR